jgi:hypothetical protein
MIIQDISAGCKGIAMPKEKACPISIARGRLQNRLLFWQKTVNLPLRATLPLKI